VSKGHGDGVVAVGPQDWCVWHRWASVGEGYGLGKSSGSGMARSSAVRAGVGAAMVSG
jgi:hypothetical protein